MTRNKEDPYETLTWSRTKCTSVRRQVLRVCAILVLLAAGLAPGATGADRQSDGSISRRQPNWASGALSSRSDQPPVLASSTSGEGWASGFHLRGINGEVRALALDHDDNLFAGGGFTWAGGVPVSMIAQWDGASWSSLGGGLGGAENFGVAALAVDQAGNLFAGGDFTTAGGVMANHIARWDHVSATWSSMGSGMNGTVWALAVGPDGSLYAGGNFTIAGGVAANYIARWDIATSSWRQLGSGMGGSYYPYVLTLAFGPDGSLYAGGRFSSAGGVLANNIARWDEATSSWHSLGSGLEPDSFVAALAFGADGSLYAGGRFLAPEVSWRRMSRRWDVMTSSWLALSSGTNDDVYALAVGSDGSLYAGGWFTIAGGTAANQIARWDLGTDLWVPLDCGMGGHDSPLGVHALVSGSDGSLYTGGRYNTAGAVGTNNVARWVETTSSWHGLGSGNGMDSEVYALTIGQDGALFAGGVFTAAGGRRPTALPAGTARRGTPWGAACQEMCLTSRPWQQGQTDRSTPEVCSPRPAA